MQLPAEEVIVPPRGWRALAKYTKIFRVSLIERMAYRGDFFLSTVLRYLPMLTTILLWHAIYEGAHTTDSTEPRLASYTYQQMIAYLLLVHISRMFSSMPGLAFGIARDIREGTLKKYLIQPLDMIGYLLSYRLAHKAAYIATSALPYALLFFVCRDFFVGLDVDLLTCAAWLLSLFLCFLIGFFFETCMGMVGFWFLQVTSFLYVVNTFNFFVSGHMFPLDLIPQPWVSVLKVLPFSYLAYFPATVILKKTTGSALIEGLLIEAAWAIGLIFFSRWLYQRGLKRYSAYGG